MIFSIIAVPGGVMHDIPIDLPPGVTTKDEEVRLGLTAATRVYTRWIRERYLSASRGDGTWAPTALQGRVRMLNPMGRRFSRMHVSTGILIRTGHLFNSMFEGGGDHLETITGSTAIVGTQDNVAIYHQWGTSKMVARTIFVPADQSTVNEMVRVIQQGVDRSFEQLQRGRTQRWDQWDEGEYGDTQNRGGFE